MSSLVSPRQCTISNVRVPLEIGERPLRNSNRPSPVTLIAFSCRSDKTESLLSATRQRSVIVRIGSTGHAVLPPSTTSRTVKQPSSGHHFFTTSSQKTPFPSSKSSVFDPADVSSLSSTWCRTTVSVVRLGQSVSTCWTSSVRERIPSRQGTVSCRRPGLASRAPHFFIAPNSARTIRSASHPTPR